MDHEQRLSFAVIFGSFRSRGLEGSELDQHYVSLSYLHEPKSGLWPAATEDETEKGSLQSEDGDKVEEGGADNDGAMPVSPTVRLSAMAERLTGWMRAQRYASLRRFGFDRLTEDKVKSPTVEEGNDKGGDNGLPAGLVEGDAGADDGADEPGRNDADLEENAGKDDGGRRGQGVRLRGPGDNEGPPDEHGYDGLRGGTMEDPRESTATVVQSVDDGESEIEEDLFEEDRDSGERSNNADATEDLAWKGESDADEQEANGSDGVPLSQVQTPPPLQPLAIKDALLLPPEASPQPQEHLERTHTFHAFPPADTVTILCKGEPVESVPNLRDDPNFTWEADGVG